MKIKVNWMNIVFALVAALMLSNVLLVLTNISPDMAGFVGGLVVSVSMIWRGYRLIDFLPSK